MNITIEEKHVEQVYSKIAKQFNNTRHYKWNYVEKFINEQPKNSTIVDIGCGNGRNMKNKNYKFIGIDTCLEFIEICTNQGLSAIYGGMTDIPLKENLCNSIISIASFHHLSTVQRRLRCFSEMNRILKPGGKLLLTVWSKTQPEKTKRKFKNYGDNYVSWKNKNDTYHRYYYIFKTDELIELAHKSGFILIDNYWECGNDIFTFEKN